MSPVKTFALDQGLGVYQPASLRRENAQRELEELQPDVIVVAAYGNFSPEALRFGRLRHNSVRDLLCEVEEAFDEALKQAKNKGAS